jgi:hypothetical protein
VSGQLHAPAILPLGKEPPALIGEEAGWVPESGLDYVEKGKIVPLLGLKLQPLDLQASSQSYRLRYPGSFRKQAECYLTFYAKR